MMTLAQRVRDFRYAKGWGPDELASRAEISRTALYQIESGKTGLPRAGTLRRIAVALDVSMDELLGETSEAAPLPRRSDERAALGSGRSMDRWYPSEGAPLNLPGGSQGGYGFSEAPRSAPEPSPRASVAPQESIVHREGELMSKLHDILHSPIGTNVARILDDLHAIVPKSRPAR